MLNQLITLNQSYTPFGLFQQLSNNNNNNFYINQLKANNPNIDFDNLTNDQKIQYIIENDLKKLFLNAVLNFMSTDCKTIDDMYLFQLYSVGINPIAFKCIVSDYIENEIFMIKKSKNNYPTFKHFYKFIDDLYLTFKDEYLNNLSLKGITKLNL